MHSLHSMQDLIQADMNVNWNISHASGIKNVFGKYNEIDSIFPSIPPLPHIHRLL